MAMLRLFRLTARLLLAVMLLGALAPTVSRALAATRGATMVGGDLCHTPGVPPAVFAGAVRFVLSAQAVSDSSPAAPALDHCPFCLLVTERLGPPSALAVHFFDAEPGLALPDARTLFPPILFPMPTLPRGPPRHA